MEHSLAFNTFKAISSSLVVTLDAKGIQSSCYFHTRARMKYQALDTRLVELIF